MSNDVFSPKERLLRALKKEKTDRQPVICPGGMMNAAIVDVMKKNQNVLPDAHYTQERMSALAYDVHKYTGFENFGIPFCMTIEAEMLGSSIDYGTLECEPKIEKEAFPSVSAVELKPLGIINKNPRAEAVVQTLYHLSQKYPDIPAIGSLTGPVSTTASIVDPMQFLREVRKDRENTHRVMDYVTRQLLEYAKLMADNGASVIAIADPTATSEILGPKMFEEYAVRYLNILTDGIHVMGIPVIVHICGKMETSRALCAELHGDALSVDAFVSLKNLKKEFSQITTMGNLSTILLQTADPGPVSRHTEKLIRDGIDILAPACGLSTSTPLENIEAFTKTVKNI